MAGAGLAVENSSEGAASRAQFNACGWSEYICSHECVAFANRDVGSLPGSPALLCAVRVRLVDRICSPGISGLNDVSGWEYETTEGELR